MGERWSEVAGLGGWMFAEAWKGDAVFAGLVCCCRLEACGTGGADVGSRVGGGGLVAVGLYGLVSVIGLCSLGAVDGWRVRVMRGWDCSYI